MKNIQKTPLEQLKNDVRQAIKKYDETEDHLKHGTDSDCVRCALGKIVDLKRYSFSNRFPSDEYGIVGPSQKGYLDIHVFSFKTRNRPKVGVLFG